MPDTDVADDLDVSATPKKIVWKDLSLSNKILSGFIALSVLMILSISITIYKASVVEKSAKIIIEQQQPAVYSLLHISDLINRATSNLNAYLLTGHDEYQEQYYELEETIQVELKIIRDMIDSGETNISSELFAEIEELYKIFTVDAEELFKIRNDILRNYPGMQKALDLLNPVHQEYMGLISMIIYDEAAKPATKHQQQVLALLYDVRYSWSQMISSLRLFLDTRAERDLKNIDIYLSANQEKLTELHKIAPNVGEEVAFNGAQELTVLNNQYKNHLSGIIKIYLSEAWRQDAYIMKTKVGPETAQMRTLLNNIVSEQINESKQMGYALAEDIGAIRILSIVLIFGGMFICVFVFLFITRAIVPPVRNLMLAARAVAKGSLDVQVPVESQDEIGSLAESFNSMVSNLNAMESAKNMYLQEVVALNESLEQRVADRTLDIRRSETRLSTVLENIGDGIITIDDKGFIESINDAAKEIFFIKNELAEGMDSAGFIVNNDNISGDCLLKLPVGQPVEVVGYRQDKKTLPIEVFVTELFVDNMAKRICIIRDITQRKKSEQQLHDVAHKSGMAEMATGVLHNIGNILNSVKLSGEEIKRLTDSCKIERFMKANALLEENKDQLSTYLSEDAKGKVLPEFYIKLGCMMKEVFSELNVEINLLNEKTTMMRDVIATQQDYARASFHSEDFDLKRVLEDSLKVHDTLLKKWGVTLSRQYRDIPHCTGIRSKLLQVTTNLIKNAIEAMRENDIHNKDKQLVIETGAQDDKQVYVRIVDNGYGIAKEDLEKIFTHGFSTKSDGHGFGLHSSANAMSEMNGKMEVHSDGKLLGAQFILRLPIAADQINTHIDGHSVDIQEAS